MAICTNHYLVVLSNFFKRQSLDGNTLRGHHDKGVSWWTNHDGICKFPQNLLRLFAASSITISNTIQSLQLQEKTPVTSSSHFFCCSVIHMALSSNGNCQWQHPSPWCSPVHHHGIHLLLSIKSMSQQAGSSKISSPGTRSISVKMVLLPLMMHCMLCWHHGNFLQTMGSAQPLSIRDKLVGHWRQAAIATHNCSASCPPSALAWMLLGGAMTGHDVEGEHGGECARGDDSDVEWKKCLANL